MSQQALADRAGLSRNFVAQVERGESVPTVSTLSRIATALATTVAELMGEDLPTGEPGDTVPVPLVADSIAAGPPMFVADHVERYEKIPYSLLRNLGVDPRQPVLVRLGPDQDSMAETIPGGLDGPARQDAGARGHRARDLRGAGGRGRRTRVHHQAARGGRGLARADPALRQPVPSAEGYPLASGAGPVGRGDRAGGVVDAARPAPALTDQRFRAVNPGSVKNPYFCVLECGPLISVMMRWVSVVPVFTPLCVTGPW